MQKPSLESTPVFFDEVPLIDASRGFVTPVCITVVAKVKELPSLQLRSMTRRGFS
jgi:hypothetical protein